ncbi:glycoprotein B-like protein [Ovine gammaherpesvirus 2]|uniref:Glycoprotein B-like protein n=1 Tax=Ovine gammaherpesvirus 2 TaxID=10398 RepID=A1BM00_9GAMA|nr:glycoprotein B-like protein [Ovine gammaherpesvirus 2]
MASPTSTLSPAALTALLCLAACLGQTPTPPTTEDDVIVPGHTVSPDVLKQQLGSGLNEEEGSINRGPMDPSAFPFRVCSASNIGDIFRFQTTHSCPNTKDKEHNEGILLIFKENIVPYVFKVRKYRKIVTTSTVYNGIYSDAITNQHEFSKSVPHYEARRMDTIYQCYNSLSLTVGGNLLAYTDNDGYNLTVDLQPMDGLSNSVRRYNSQPEIHAEPGWLLGGYRRRTTVNCEVTDTEARSVPPFRYFVTNVGDTIEMSPFWSGGANETEPNKEPRRTVSVLRDYTLVDYKDRGSRPQPHTRIFIDKEDYTLSWAQQLKNISYCRWAHWKSFHNAIKTEHENSYHFVANDITASFFTPNTEAQDVTKTHTCLNSLIESEMTSRLEKVNGTHVTNGSRQYYLTNGGLLLVWQPLVQQKLLNAQDLLEAVASKHNVTKPARGRRQRRAVSSILIDDDVYTAESALLLTQIQFAYDMLRSQINTVLEELSRAWCREQHRASLMWNELSKINPTSVMSSIYGRPVSAKRIGDVISVSHCVVVDQQSVSLHRNMRVPGRDHAHECYSRPPVTFKFINDSHLYKGQLGVNNEILLTTTALEVCHENTEHYFQGGNNMYFYKNYRHVKTIPVSAVATLDTFIVLNLTLVENIDFQVIELYSREEKRMSTVFDIETMFREYNYYTQRVTGLRRDLSDIATNRNQFVDAFGTLMDDLGVVGKTVVNAVSSLATLFSSIVTGLINFIKNPFGGMLIFGLLAAVVIAVILLRRRAASFAANPVQMIYPDIQQITKQRQEMNVEPISKHELDRIMLAMHDYHQTKQDKPDEKEGPESGGSANKANWLNKAKNVLRRRAGYQPLKRSDSTESAAAL